MARVVPWPGDQQPGHVNLEYCFKQVGSNGKKNWSGKPHRTVNDFLSFAAWATQQSEIGDIYFCLSLQGRTGQTNAGKLKTARHAKDALGELGRRFERNGTRADAEIGSLELEHNCVSAKRA